MKLLLIEDTIVYISGKVTENHFGHVIHGQLKTNLFGQFERNTQLVANIEFLQPI